MWRKQEDQEGLEVQRHDFDESFTWEEQAFAEDSAAVWPPRSYSCSFCRREFRSAQALGGHMNVHRRDRARLKQSPSINITLPYHLPNPKSTYSPDRVISCGDRSDSKMANDESLRISCCPRVRDEDRVGIGILDESRPPSLDFGFGRPWPTSGLFDHYDAREEAAGAVTGYKKRKTDDETTIQFHVKKSSSLVERHQHQHQHQHHRHHIHSEVIGLDTSSLHDLDLELRLGGLSKG